MGKGFETNDKFNSMKNIIFLDIDGVLNCQLMYEAKFQKGYKEVKKELRWKVKHNTIEKLDFYSKQIDSERVQWLNELCEKTDSQIVVSSTWRKGKTIEELQEIFDYCGGTFKILDKTGNCGCRTRGCEINVWLSDNCQKYFGIESHSFTNYAIIDDDSDMLLNQQANFFPTDNYSGLTPNTCYKINLFFNRQSKL